MKHGYGIIHRMKDELLNFMAGHDFNTIEDFKGHALQYFTSHTELVTRQADARAKKKVLKDADWKGETFVKQSEALSGE
jgi:hypothetical protein